MAPFIKHSFLIASQACRRGVPLKSKLKRPNVQSLCKYYAKCVHKYEVGEIVRKISKSKENVGERKCKVSAKHVHNKNLRKMARKRYKSKKKVEEQKCK